MVRLIWVGVLLSPQAAQTNRRYISDKAAMTQEWKLELEHAFQEIERIGYTITNPTFRRVDEILHRLRPTVSEKNSPTSP